MSSISDHIRRNISLSQYSLVCIATSAPIFPVRITYNFYDSLQASNKVTVRRIFVSFTHGTMRNFTYFQGFWRHFSRVKPFRVILKLVVYVRYFHFNRYLYFKFILFSFIGFCLTVEQKKLNWIVGTNHYTWIWWLYKLEHHYVNIQSKK